MPGGKRAGAGRKPKAATKVIDDISAEVLRTVDAKAKWIALLNCGEPKVTADVMKYLTDRVHGKPAQAVMVQGDPNKPLEVIIRILGK